jgi:Polyketide cyclase / dehydrase and lipid transport
VRKKLPLTACVALAVRRLYRAYASGAITVDLGVGRRLQPLGPVTRRIAAPRELVFDVISAPYLERTSRALQQRLQVWERGSDMVLAAHFTPVKCGVTTTVETVRFERPGRVSFRVVRGPVPHVAESFLLDHVDGGTELTWEGELGTDLWLVGAWWGSRVARSWTKVVQASLAEIAVEAERRAARTGGS